ncbi:MAG: hypothetical protein AAGF12_10190 [Myxococcota bacterium]
MRCSTSLCWWFAGLLAMALTACQLDFDQFQRGDAGMDPADGDASTADASVGDASNDG